MISWYIRMRSVMKYLLYCYFVPLKWVGFILELGVAHHALARQAMQHVPFHSPFDFIFCFND